VLCPDCASGLPALPARCYRCRKRSPGGLTCASCRSSSRLYAVTVRTNYSGTAKTVIWSLKFDGAQAAAAELATSLSRRLTIADPAGLYVVPVPTTTRRCRQRGYDQAKLMAQALAQQLQLPYLDCLRRSGLAHQVGASRRERLRQLEDAFRVTKPLAGARILLVDDVITTGATLEAAARVCKRAGARRVEAVAFAQP